MPDDTPALTSRDLETIKAALWPVWLDLQNRGEHPAADWISARINDCTGETVQRGNRLYDELAAIAAGSGHITLISHDEVAGEIEAGPWLAVCVTCDGPGYNPAAVIGYFSTEAEADAARARHVEEAGDR